MGIYDFPFEGIKAWQQFAVYVQLTAVWGQLLLLIKTNWLSDLGGLQLFWFQSFKVSRTRKSVLDSYVVTEFLVPVHFIVIFMLKF